MEQNLKSKKKISLFGKIGLFLKNDWEIFFFAWFSDSIASKFIANNFITIGIGIFVGVLVYVLKKVGMKQEMESNMSTEYKK